ncbi:MAG TPA: gluconate 2-dehydrogenase subunit 3 family protein, partial [Longimicrobiales bacterium]|nr:gluconate 2-dehydrogenase subunit 3 family protein [Longimicrobiales bacterium]
ELGAQDFIDEWIGAPWEGNEQDRILIRGGLVWLDREAARRFGEGLRFRELSLERKWAICDDLCRPEEVAPGFEAGARFFDRVRDLTATAFWTTEEGMRDIGYVGNTPLPSWGPPPPEVLRHLGLE